MVSSGNDALIFKDRPSPFTPGYTTSYYGDVHQGVFLNQNPQFQSGLPIYSIKAPNTFINPQTGQAHQLYFLGWNYIANKIGLRYPQATETAVVFKDDNADLTANLKGTQLSDNTAAYLNNNQKKLLRTTYGTAQLNSVYESINKVWLEASTDGGANWSILNNGSPLSTYKSTSPAISPYQVPSQSWMLVTFAESYDNVKFNDLKVMRIIPNTSQVVQQLTLTDGFSDGDFNTPVIASNANQNTVTNFVLVFKVLTQDTYNGWSPGIYYCVGYVPNNGFEFVWLGSPQLIPGTNASSYSPTISTNYNHYTSSCEYKIAWEQKTTSTSSNILSRNLYVSGIQSVTATLSSTTTNISYGCGFTQNSNPSLITVNNNVVKAVWFGGRQVNAEEEQNGPQSLNGVTNWEYKVVYKDLTTGTQKIYGTRTNPPSINKRDDNSQCYITYSEQSNQAAKLVFGNQLNTINDLERTGQDVQMGNGTTDENVKAIIFNRSAIPYYFRTSPNLSNITPKINLLAIQSGREGIVYEDSAQFYFAIGDVMVNQLPVEFKPLPDTIQINTKELVNAFLETETFTLSDNSNFFFSVQYGITDSSAAIQLLSDNKTINFKVEIIEAVSGEILDSFDNVIYSQDSVYQYNNIAYQVNTAGLGNIQVKLRLVINSSNEFNYSLSERFAEETALGKSFKKQIYLDGSGLVKEYDLEQNFPNPFNPATTIRYQIPQNGIVTLKIYDILGSEIATLVNEEKVAGRYEVNLNASSLASGVYVYKIQSGSFISSKKMILLK
jgi:hypothetical protein